MPYVNITALLEDKPDQGLYKDKGGRSFPYAVFMDQDGAPLLSVDLNDRELLTVKMARAKELAKIVREFAEKPKSKQSWANKTLLDLKLKRRAAAMEDLEKAAKTRGVDKLLKAHFDSYKRRAPIQAAVDLYYNTNDEETQKNAKADMFALYKKGLKIEEPQDELFIQYWNYAFDGALEASDVNSAKKLIEEFKKHLDGELAALVNVMQRRLKRYEEEQK